METAITAGDRRVACYINRIRNEAKRQYAYAFYGHLLTGGPEPSEPSNLGVMASQAVRMRLRELMKGI